MTHTFDVIVAGCGIAGLCAAVAAAQGGATVAVLERAPMDERGGNTRYTDAYLRMKSETEVTDDFETHLAENGGGYLDPELIKHTTEPYAQWPAIVKTLSFADPELIAAFANACGPTVQWLKTFGVKFDFLPTQFLTKSQPRLLPIGGGLALVEALAAAAEQLGVKFFYETTAVSLTQDHDLTVTGLNARGKMGEPLRFKGKVILGCGGFEGNAEMQTRYIGARAVYLRPVARGGYYNKGEGIRMALAIGAATCGDFGSYHAEPIDPRSGRPEPSVFVFPYGILVNQEGLRFTDEAPGTVDAVYESITRKIFNQTNGIAYTLLDQKINDVPNYKLGLRSDQPPITGATLAELAAKLKMPADVLEKTVREYNAACIAGTFKALELDHLATLGLNPPKSNWARPLDKPPFEAYPVISSNVLTFGGLKVNTRAQVLNQDGVPIKNLYAAGEVVGIYYKTYTGATSVLKGAVFGRLAGVDAAAPPDSHHPKESQTMQGQS
ncbi:MAG: FAD-dependent oxidoreductase [Betaproteobacteria bacterium]|nr:FAD-dependent oxidoreductase [Betaproteobacteria bacterium]